MKNAYCAIDLGATSGRIVISSDGLELEEIYRFPNSIYEQEGRYFWDTDRLMSEIITGLRLLTSREDIHVCSIGVDTWGVDVVFLKGKRALAHPRAYRDPYTEKVMEELFTRIPRTTVYQKTGIQFLNFNTLFQMYACHKQQYEPFLQADSYLFIPDYFNYLLTGKMVCEYTILSTSQMMNAYTHQPDMDLLQACGAKAECFPKMVMPGEKVGVLQKHIADFGYEVPVIAVAGHDTASAVATVPRTKDGKHVAYLSSGTWSLMGIVTDEPIITADSEQMNFTNEGGVGGKARFLKNITGMWILEQCRKEWSAQGQEYAYPSLVAMAETVTDVPELFNPDEPRFANPTSMIEQVTAGRDLTVAQITACIFHSLAKRYAEVFGMLCQLAPWEIGALYVIGGGARNAFLNRLTQEAIGVPVIVGAVEATALGNIQIQMQSVIKN